MKKIFTTTLRLNLMDEDDRRAYDHLKGMDKRQYRSYSKAIVAAINDHFEWQERLDADPYLETRQKEDAFLQRVMETIEEGMRYVPAVVQTIQPAAPVKTTDTDDESLSAALDFADSF